MTTRTEDVAAVRIKSTKGMRSILEVVGMKGETLLELQISTAIWLRMTKEGLQASYPGGSAYTATFMLVADGDADAG